MSAERWFIPYCEPYQSLTGPHLTPPSSVHPSNLPRTLHWPPLSLYTAVATAPINCPQQTTTENTFWNNLTICIFVKCLDGMQQLFVFVYLYLCICVFVCGWPSFWNYVAACMGILYLYLCVYVDDPLCIPIFETMLSCRLHGNSVT